MDKCFCTLHQLSACFFKTPDIELLALRLGVHYVQCPLGYPNERRQRLGSLLLVESPEEIDIKARQPSQVTNPSSLPALVYSSIPEVKGSPADGSPSLVYDGTHLTGESLAPAESRDGSTPSICRPLKGRMYLRHAKWSDYYESNERVPQNLELAPWSASRYRRHPSST